MKVLVVMVVRGLRARLREWVRPEHPWSVEDELFNMGRKR